MVSKPGFAVGFGTEVVVSIRLMFDELSQINPVGIYFNYTTLKINKNFQFFSESSLLKMNYLLYVFQKFLYQFKHGGR